MERHQNRHSCDTDPHPTRDMQQTRNQHGCCDTEYHSDLPSRPQGMDIKLLKNIPQAAFIHFFPVISVINDQCCRCSDSHSDQTLYIQISGYIITIKQKVTKQQCGMIEHHHIVAAQHHKEQDTYGVYKKFLYKPPCICQTRAKSQYGKHKCQCSHRMWCPDSEIRKPECHHAQQNYNTHNAVAISKNLTESNNHCHAKCHGQAYFK